MTLGAKRPRPNLRQGLDRDVYLVLKKLEDANDGKPFKTTTAVYEAIKRSNSSLSRQKKRPLEDSIDRVLQYRKEELGGDSSDSEAALEEPSKPDDDRFLLNRQMTKHWHQTSTPATTPASQDTAPQPTSEVPRAIKKRRVQEDGEERAKDGAVTPKGALTDTDAAPAEKQEKTPLKKTQKSSRHKVEHPSDSVQLGGVADIFKELAKHTHYLLKQPELCAANRWRRTPGILLSGPPGTGKKSLIRLLASKVEVPIVYLTGCLEEPERMERSLNDAIEEAMRVAPCIIFIEQLDWYMSKPGSSTHSEGHRRNVTQFMRQMRRIEQEQENDRPILAMATTSRITDVDPAILKTGFFEDTVQMRVPDLNGRLDILKLMTKDGYLSENVDFSELAKITHGFVGADIISVVTRAQRVAAERTMDLSQFDKHLEQLPSNQLPDLMELVDEQPPASFLEPSIEPLTQEDFKTVIKDFTPLLRKEGFTVIPNVTWEQVGALEAAREQLDLSIIGPIQNPEDFREMGISRPAGCLLWGPPGCGKTLVAQAVANQAQASFILINGPELLNKYVGESERAVRELFNRARSSAPCILFFDEMDSLVPKRDSGSTEAGTRVVNALLTELDGVKDRTGVYVIGTTNRPDMIDPAMLRPGRLNVRLFIDLPTPDERVDILRAIYRTNHPNATAAEFERLDSIARDARCTDFSGADLGALRVKAAQSAMKRYLKTREKTTINEDDWEHALSTTYRSVQNPETYRKLEVKLGKS
ncbi:hypothetical protein F53441_13634 [Fusarium austroafricanum]|uniref:Peroxisomal ATPase PEX1 n=1 Tax=Fusarium austroafricanum TaxID=2364996 RepID=A0A8H4JM92_9HYPO|nr:hypothetical protein F53441_13634 [Fusarium austroafricanum]